MPVLAEAPAKQETVDPFVFEGKNVFVHLRNLGDGEDYRVKVGPFQVVWGTTEEILVLLNGRMIPLARNRQERWQVATDELKREFPDLYSRESFTHAYISVKLF